MRVAFSSNYFLTKTALMIKIFVITTIMASLSCGTPSQKSNSVIGDEEPEPVTTTTNTSTAPVVEKRKIPKGAIEGNFNGDAKLFYAQVSRVDSRNEKTFISFEDKKLPNLVIPKTIGGALSTIILDGFDRDLLLVTAKIKDPQFKKYYLYVLRNNQWKPVVNGFAIHKSNLKKVVAPIQIDPNNSSNLLRYYSVFNLDKGSPSGYSWLLQNESIPIENR